MRCYNFNGIINLWEDFTSAIKEYEVVLRYSCIYQVLDVKDSKDENKGYKIHVTKNHVGSKEPPRSYWIAGCTEKEANELKKAGCFYEIKIQNGNVDDTIKFYPNEEVKSRCFHDYFKITKNNSIDNVSSKEDVLILASKFRKIGKIIFIAKKYNNHKFSELIGMKSISGANQIRCIDIIKSLDKKYGSNIKYYTNYTEQSSVGYDFNVVCKNDNWISKNKVNVGVKISDNASARKSMRIDVIAYLNEREYIIDSIELNHRTLQSPDKLVEEINNMINNTLSSTLNINASIKDIETTCLQFIPKKAQSKFKSLMLSSKLKPIETAYDILNTDIFNLKLKTHKTNDYDGGKRKYELALGKIVKN